MKLLIHVLGPPQILRDGQPIAYERRKTLALLAYLAVAGGTHRRESLATLLWPEQDQTAARASLRRALAELTPSLGPWLLADRETIGLADVADVRVDLRELAAVLAAHQHDGAICERCVEELEAAAALWRGEFLAGFTLRDAPEFDTWQFHQAEEQRRRAASLFEQLTTAHQATNNHSAALAAARRWLMLDQLDEHVHRTLMQLYYANGQRNAALRQFRELERVLAAELGVAPHEDTARLFAAISAGAAHTPDPRAMHSPFEQARAVADGTPQPLPAAPTTLLGRNDEQTLIDQWFAGSSSRLLSLVGPGGIGKTCLALHTAHRYSQQFNGQTAFVALANLLPSDSIASAISLALGVPISTTPEHQLRASLGATATLLVLDNFEHVQAQVGLLADLLAAAPALRLLVTSRERLHLRGEQVLDLHGLPAPDDSSSAALDDYPATRLFLERASQADSSFQPTAADAPAIAEICRLVGGSPLAIELAAAWVRVLPCEAIAAELRTSLELLATTTRDLPERHRSMRAVFTHSWDLLNANERRLFRTLAVFQSGFDRQAAASVASADMRDLAALTDKSLLQRTGPQRYQLHELLRQFAAEHAEQTAEHPAIVAQHSAHYLQRVADAAANGTIAEMHGDIDNVLAAWQVAVRRGDVAALGQAMNGIGMLLMHVGRFLDLAEVLQSAIAALGARTNDHTAQELIGQMLSRQANMYTIVGRYEQARVASEQAMPLLQQYSSDKEITLGMQRYALWAIETGAYNKARHLLEGSLERCRATNDSEGISWSLDILGYLIGEMGQYEEAARLLQEALDLRRVRGQREEIAKSLINLGYLYELSGQHGAARQSLEEGIGIANAHGIGKAVVAGQLNLGFVALAQQHTTEAQQLFTSALAVANDKQIVRLMLLACVGFGAIAVQQNRHEEAIELLSLALHHPASNQEARDRACCFLADAAADLPFARASNAKERGRVRRIEDVAAELLHRTFPSQNGR